MNKTVLISILLLTIVMEKISAQTVVVTDDPSYFTGQASSVLDIKSISKGLLIPRMTTAQRTAVASPAEGLMVYQIDGTKGFYYFTNSAWVPLATGTSTQWTTSGTNIYYNGGNVGIGTTTPATALQIVGTNPLTLTGVQTGATTDSILTIASGTVRKLSFATVTSSTSWSLLGNTGTNYATNFLGTSDNTSLRFRTNNTQRAIIDSLGNMGISTNTPAAKLDAAGTVKLGASGTVMNNVITFEFTTTVAFTINAASLSLLGLGYTPTSNDMTITVPTLSGSRGVVSVSFGSDLPASISVAYARVISNTQIKIRFLNTGSTANQTIPIGQKIEISIIDF